MQTQTERGWVLTRHKPSFRTISSYKVARERERERETNYPSSTGLTDLPHSYRIGRDSRPPRTLSEHPIWFYWNLKNIILQFYIEVGREEGGGNTNQPHSALGRWGGLPPPNCFRKWLLYKLVNIGPSDTPAPAANNCIYFPGGSWTGPWPPGPGQIRTLYSRT